VETNHDEQRLQADPKRPWSVKQRILSRHGHLSNEAAAALVADIAGENLRRVVLGHLSRECNSPELALSAMRQLGLDSLEFYCAEQNQVSPRFEVGSRPSSRALRQNDRSAAGSLAVSEKVNPVARGRDDKQQTEYLLDLGWHFDQAQSR
jgi:Metal-dependent hydrolases of the beta-lactamase superfamily I